MSVESGARWPALTPGPHLKSHENQADTREAVCSDRFDRAERAIARQFGVRCFEHAPVVSRPLQNQQCALGSSLGEMRTFEVAKKCDFGLPLKSMPIDTLGKEKAAHILSCAAL
jgi:hypothetical protein